MKFITLLLIFSLNSYAIDFEACNSTSEEGFKKCLKEFSKSTKKFGEAPRVCIAAIKGMPLECPPLSNTFSKDGAKCENFISEDSSKGYGPWGNVISQYLDEKGTHSIFFKNDLPGMFQGINTCPKWEIMNHDEKKHFWVWTMAAIAHVESKCIPTARNRNATNGVATGLYQLDERPSMRSWRGENCGAKNILEPNSNIRCGLDIMGDLLNGSQGIYRTSGELWGSKSKSYWEHLRRKDGGTIGNLIKQNPYCNKQ